MICIVTEKFLFNKCCELLDHKVKARKAADKMQEQILSDN